MRFDLLLAGAFFISAQTNSAILIGATVVHSRTTGSNNVSVQRFLRAHAFGNEVNEERAGPISSGTLADHFRWESDNELPEKVFDELKLKFRGIRLVDDSKVNKWLRYTKAVFANAVSDVNVKIHFSDKLYQMLAAARETESTKKLAEEVQHLQVEAWLARGYTPDKLLEVLEIDHHVDNVVTSTKLLFMAEYVDAFKVKQPSFKEDAIDVLRAHFKNDKTVFWVLENAKKVGGTKELVTKWQNKQIESWVENSAVFDPDMVFKILKLDIAELDDLLTSPYMRIWTQYMERVSPDKTGMVQVLLMHFFTPRLNEVLERAKGVQDTNGLATKLQEQLLARWMENEKCDAGMVYTELHLNFERDPLLNPNLKLWFRYLEWSSQEKGDNLASMALTSFDNEAHMEIVLMAAMKDSSFNDMAYKLLMAAMKKPKEATDTMKHSSRNDMAYKVLMTALEDRKATYMAFKLLMDAKKDPEATDLASKVLTAAMEDPKATDMVFDGLMAAIRDPEATYMTFKLLMDVKKDPEATGMASKVLTAAMEDPKATDMVFDGLMAAIRDPKAEYVAFKLLMDAKKDPEATGMASKVLEAAMKDPKVAIMVSKVLVTAKEDSQLTDMASKLLMAAMKDSEVTMASDMLMNTMREPRLRRVISKVLRSSKENPSLWDRLIKLMGVAKAAKVSSTDIASVPITV